MGYNIKIDWKPLPANSKIQQMYSNGLEYALVSADYKQCNQFVWCKDFLHDVIYGTLNNQLVEIYKFRYNPKFDATPCLDRARILIANSKDKKFAEKIPNVIDFINQIEEQLKIKKSFVRQCANPPKEYSKSGVFMFEGSKRWIQSPPMLSLYTLLLRVGCCHTVGESFVKTIDGIKSGEIKPYQRRDCYLIKRSDIALKKILRVGDRKIFYRNIQLNYPSNMMIDSIHNKLGIIGFATEILYNSISHPVLVPYWHYQK